MHDTETFTIQIRFISVVSSSTELAYSYLPSYPEEGTQTTEKPCATGIDSKDLPEGDYWDDEGSNHHISKRREYFKYLKEINQGWRKGPVWVESAHMTTNANDGLISSVSGQLDLLQRERSRAKKIFMGIDLGKMGVRKDRVAVAICAYVVEKDKRDQRRGHPQVDDEERNFPGFSELAEMFHLNQRLTERVYYQLEQRYR